MIIRILYFFFCMLSITACLGFGTADPCVTTPCAFSWTSQGSISEATILASAQTMQGALELAAADAGATGSKTKITATATPVVLESRAETSDIAPNATLTELTDLLLTIAQNITNNMIIQKMVLERLADSFGKIQDSFGKSDAPAATDAAQSSTSATTTSPSTNPTESPTESSDTTAEHTSATTDSIGTTATEASDATTQPASATTDSTSATTEPTEPNTPATKVKARSPTEDRHASSIQLSEAPLTLTNVVATPSASSSAVHASFVALPAGIARTCIKYNVLQEKRHARNLDRRRALHGRAQPQSCVEWSTLSAGVPIQTESVETASAS